MKIYIQRIPLKDSETQIVEVSQRDFEADIPDGYDHVSNTFKWHITDNHVVMYCQVKPSGPESPYPGNPSR